MKIKDIEELFNQSKRNEDYFLYLNKEKLDKEIKGFNLYSIMKEVFPKNKQGLIHIPLKTQIQIPMSQYAEIIQAFLQVTAQNGFQHLIID
jgi:hypothetical protein